MKFFTLLITLILLQVNLFSQPANDNCADAEILCDSKTTSGNTASATNEICATCGDGATASGVTCFTFEKTVWYSFTTNGAGGNVDINVTNVNCVGAGNNISGMVYSAGTPCNASTYTQISNCEANSGVGFSLNTTGLAPNTTYYVQISSGKDCGFDVVPSGAGITQGATSSVVITSSAPGTICEQTPVTFTATPTNCNNPVYSWTINGFPAQTGGATFNTSSLTNGDVVSTSITCNCSPGSTSNSITSTMFQNTLNAGPDETIPFGTSTELNGSGSTNYSWSPTNTLSDPSISNPTATPDGTTTYKVTTTSTDGCVFSDSVVITVVDDITAPNTFTPNGDGTNDTWQILNIENFPKVKITIYDRWGQQVYKTIGYPPSKWWDGTRGGKKLPASTYYYVISLSVDAVQEKLVTGSVTIVY